MRSVLGIDAAWTANQPSGIALIIETTHGWNCRAIAPSYQAFLALAESDPVDWSARHFGERPDPARLLSACQKLCGVTPTVAAIDMPLATVPITARRAADNLVSQKFGAFGCAVHSPTAIRPGPIGHVTTAGFTAAGFALAVKGTPSGTAPALIEVYPHVAILRLMALSYRLPYKAARSGKYWHKENPKPDGPERVRRLLGNFAALTNALKREIAGVDIPLPPPETPMSLSRLKPYEDAIDALVCAWVGAEYLAGRTEAFGDSTGAIWAPKAVP